MASRDALSWFDRFSGGSWCPCPLCSQYCLQTSGLRTVIHDHLDPTTVEATLKRHQALYKEDKKGGPLALVEVWPYKYIQEHSHAQPCAAGGTISPVFPLLPVFPVAPANSIPSVSPDQIKDHSVSMRNMQACTFPQHLCQCNLEHHIVRKRALHNIEGYA